MNPPYCAYCPAPLSDGERAKRHPTCTACQTTNWQSPKPVVLMLQPVLTSDGLGLVVGKRGIAPAKGEWALPGGFVEIGETSLEGACREFREESLTTWTWNRPAHCILLGDLPSTSGPQQLQFVQNNVAMDQQAFHDLKDTHEMSDWAIMTLDGEIELCWPSHQQVAREWLESQPQHRGAQPSWVLLPAFRR